MLMFKCAARRPGPVSGPTARVGLPTCGAPDDRRSGGALLAEPRAATLQPGRDVIVRELAAGKLLVAARNLPDPNFTDTVVLLVSTRVMARPGSW